MSAVVPVHKLNKYGGVYTSEIRDTRNRKLTKGRRWQDEIAVYVPTNNDIGQGSIQANPASSSHEIQHKIYKNLFKTY